MMTASATAPQSRFGYDDDREEKLDARTTGGARNLHVDGGLPIGSATCIFWCAVAIGALVQGRPVESVSHFCTYMSPASSAVNRRLRRIATNYWILAPNVAGTVEMWFFIACPHALLSQVARYCQLAMGALANCSGPASPELAQ